MLHINQGIIEDSNKKEIQSKILWKYICKENYAKVLDIK